MVCFGKIPEKFLNEFGFFLERFRKSFWICVVGHNIYLLDLGFGKHE